MFQPVSSDNSNASNLNQVNELARQVQSSERTQIFKDDAGTRRVLLGKGLNDFYGLKVSPAGTDVYDAADSGLIFNSNQNVFKIVRTGTATVTTSGYGYFSTTIAHGLSSTPAAVGFTTFPSAPTGSYGILPFTVFSVPTTGLETSLSSVAYAAIAVDSTNVVFAVTQIAGGLTDGSWTFKYYLLQETAN